MSKYALSIGMATHQDFHGVFMTVQALRLYQDVSDCEIVIVDNDPDTDHGEHVRGLVEHIKTFMPVKYIPFTENAGTTQTRERLFAEAEGDAVLVMDCHVLLQANAIYNLKKFYAEASPEDRLNLYTGPLLYDGLNFCSTHFECEWRDQMWGVWATAWKHPDGTLITCRENSGMVEMKKLNTDGPWNLTQIPWGGHEKALIDRGYTVAGMNSYDEPFEIPAQGLGLFSSTKEGWLGFNPNFRAFGGEECYIHEKYRRRGRKTMCLPFLKWNHRFGRPGGPKYPLTMEGKIRNYLIGFDELGFDREPIRHHFVDEIKVPQATYDAIARDPVSFQPYQPQKVTVAAVGTSNLGLPLPTAYENLNDLVNWVAANERDLNQHASNFMVWTAGMNHVVELTKRRESTALFLGALGRKLGCGKCETACDREKCNRPAVLYSYQEEQDSLLGMLQDAVKSHPGRPLEYTVIPYDHTNMVDSIPETDLLFIDTRHKGERLLDELKTYSPKVSSRIIMHDTALYGMTGEENTKGLLWAIRVFCAQNPEWFIAYHTDAQYGLTVLSRLPEDRPSVEIKVFPGTLDKNGERCGCGQELKATLKLLGIEAAPGCSCNRRAIIMDQNGPMWCRQNIEEILDWLKEEADARNMGALYVRPVVKMAVLRAIRAAEKKIAKGECS